MQLDRNEAQLLDSLNRFIRELERVEDDPRTITFVSRRIGNIVKHMKDLREDLRPRGNGHSPAHRPLEEEKGQGRLEARQ
jgi:hypothetical protein